MAENPLLPHRKLQELYTLIEQCRRLETKEHAKKKHASKQHVHASREAVLAATSIHLEPGDALSAAPGDQASSLAPPSPGPHQFGQGFISTLPRLLALAAIARGLQLADSNRILLALTSTHLVEPSWNEAFTWAQTDRLPIVFTVVDAPPHGSARPTSSARTTRTASSANTTKSAGKLTWPHADALCKRLHLPTLTVDGDDAVAVFRVMQEAALRARTGLGPSVIWAVLQPENVAPLRSLSPSARLRKYMSTRGIALPR